MYRLSNQHIECVLGGIAPVNTTPPGLSAQQIEELQKAQAQDVSAIVDFFAGLWAGLTS